ncbi:hypothetical protein [Moraxella oblonga]|uniref:hypothetical protein n=1 Tax=Moraxella oblonga TaxID=200413 RepID=UPI00083767D7|nr:hypothetical protein [Moraxella oblonga]
MKAIKLLAVAVALSSGVAMANNAVTNAGKTLFNTAKNPAAVSLEVGTLGYGANVAWSANETAEVVVGWAGGKTSTDIDLNDNDSIINWNKVLGDEYEDFVGNVALNTDFNNPYVGVKVRPFANRFTVGTGVIFQRNDIDAKLTAKESSDITINGTRHTVPTSGEVNIHAESGRSLAPYLTVGFKPNSDKRFGMFGEIGAVYTGDWKTRVEVSESVQNSAPNLQSELEKKIKDDNLSWYPIVKLGATVRF